MKRIISVAVILCILMSVTAIFGGCSSDKAKDWPVSYNGVNISKEPENIVVLNDVHADIISYIGYNGKMVGRSTECDQDYLYVVPTMGTAAAPEVNAISNAGADLVIADSTLSADAKSTIESNGAKVVTMGVPTNEDELKQLYIDLGTVLGGNETGSKKGEDSYNELFDMLNKLNTSTSNIVQTAAYLYLDENNQLCTFTQGSLEFKFFNYNGNANVFANQQTPKVNPQELHLGSPNYLFYDDEQVLSVIAADDSLKSINAMKTGHTLKISKKSFERYGSSVEKAVFEMLRFIEQINKATKDEAAPAASAAPAATQAAPKATVAATAAADASAPKATAAVAETTAPASAQSGDDVIVYSIE